MTDYESFVASKRRAEVATGHTPGDLNNLTFSLLDLLKYHLPRLG